MTWLLVATALVMLWRCGWRMIDHRPPMGVVVQVERVDRRVWP